MAGKAAAVAAAVGPLPATATAADRLNRALERLPDTAAAADRAAYCRALVEAITSGDGRHAGRWAAVGRIYGDPGRRLLIARFRTFSLWSRCPA